MYREQLEMLENVLTAIQSLTAAFLDWHPVAASGECAAPTVDFSKLHGKKCDAQLRHRLPRISSHDEQYLAAPPDNAVDKNRR